MDINDNLHHNDNPGHGPEPTEEELRSISPPAVFTEEHEGHLNTVDFSRLLGLAYFQKIHLNSMRTRIFLPGNEIVELSKPQTIAMLRYIKAISESPMYGSRSADAALMDHPKIVALLNEVNANA